MSDVERLAEELERFRKQGARLSPVGATAAAEAILASPWLAARVQAAGRGREGGGMSEVYRPCAGCDSVGDSCRAVGCLAAPHPTTTERPAAEAVGSEGKARNEDDR